MDNPVEKSDSPEQDRKGPGWFPWGGIGGLSAPFVPPGAADRFGAGFRRTFAALSIRNYRLFFFGHGLSLIGTWMRRTAMGWLVYEITGKMSLLGTIMALSLAPLFFLSPLTGAIADKIDKRRIIIVSQIMAGLVSAAIAYLIWRDRVEVWHLMVLATLGGAAFALEVPARQSFVVEMVGREHLLNAIALNSALINGARIVGPAVAGFVMGTVGMAACFALDALSYVVVIPTLLMMRLPLREKKREREPAMEMLTGGIREAWRNPTVKLVLGLLMATGVFGWSFQTLLPAIAQDVLFLSENRYGLLLAMFGVGAILGALFTASREAAANRKRHLFGGVWFMLAGLALLTVSRSFWPMCLALLITGFGGVMFVSTGNTMVQLNVSDEIRGRVMGIWALAFGGSLPLGAFLAGWTADILAHMPDLAFPVAGKAFSGPNAAFLTVGLFAVAFAVLALTIRQVLGPRASASVTGPVTE